MPVKLLFILAAAAILSGCTAPNPHVHHFIVTRRDGSVDVVTVKDKQ